MTKERPDVLAKPWKTDANYQAYVQIQAEKTARKRNNMARRIRSLAILLTQKDGRLTNDLDILSIGSRNTFELDELRLAGYRSVTGIDLLSMHPEILPMDMHAMTFPDKSFDALFSCHNLEHAYDLDVCLREWARVTRPGGTWAIELPVRYETCGTDRQDVGGKQGLLYTLYPYIGEILFCEESSANSPAVVRFVGRTKR